MANQRTYWRGWGPKTSNLMEIAWVILQIWVQMISYQHRCTCSQPKRRGDSIGTTVNSGTCLIIKLQNTIVLRRSALVLTKNRTRSTSIWSWERNQSPESSMTSLTLLINSQSETSPCSVTVRREWIMKCRLVLKRSWVMDSRSTSMIWGLSRIRVLENYKAGSSRRKKVLELPLRRLRGSFAHKIGSSLSFIRRFSLICSRVITGSSRSRS